MKDVKEDLRVPYQGTLSMLGMSLQLSPTGLQAGKAAAENAAGIQCGGASMQNSNAEATRICSRGNAAYRVFFQ